MREFLIAVQEISFQKQNYKTMSLDFDKIKNEFQRIKSLGFVKSNRSSKNDGAIGNTFEDYLGVRENNLKDPDFAGFEVKSKRELTSSYLSLFTKSPSSPKGANAYLKNTFGKNDEDFPLLKNLIARLSGIDGTLFTTLTN